MPMDEITAKAQIFVRKPRSKVFEAFIDPQIMSKFWFTRKDQGLREGHTVTWFVGDAPDAIQIDVRVKSIIEPAQIIIEWGAQGLLTTVTWTLSEETADVTRIIIEESGFPGSREEVLSQALASTAGFNQAIVALKAHLEHNATINIVRDHVVCGSP